MTDYKVPTRDYMRAVLWHQEVEVRGLVAVMERLELDIFASDRRNARLREAYGDTPYAAPDVDPATGLCTGGDAWPNCCTGHSWLESVLWDVIDGSRERDIQVWYTEDGKLDTRPPWTAWGPWVKTATL